MYSMKNILRPVITVLFERIRNRSNSNHFSSHITEVSLQRIINYRPTREFLIKEKESALQQVVYFTQQIYKTKTYHEGYW